MIKLFEFSTSTSIRVHWLLKELDAEFESVQVDLRSGEQFSEDYKKIHPLGKVPVLEDNGLKLFESAAICNYLCESFFEKGLIPDPATKERAIYDQWMFFISNELEAKLRSLDGHFWRYPEENRSPATVELINQEIHQALEVIEEAISKHSYIVSQIFYAVDIVLTQTLLWAKARGFGDDFKNINAYVEMNTNRPAFPRNLFDQNNKS